MIAVFSVVLIENFNFASVGFLFKDDITSSYLLPRENIIYRFLTGPKN